MSLRKSPELTPELLAATRRNAQHSTGPRSPAAQANTKMNALQHGLYAAPENHDEVMRALGEDPQEFEALKRELRNSYGPGDTLWQKEMEDLARLYWRRARLDRAHAGLVRRTLLALEERQHRRRQEMAWATFDASQLEALDLPLPEPADPDVRLRKLLSSLEVAREQVAQPVARTAVVAVGGSSAWPTEKPQGRRAGPALLARLGAVLEELYRGRMGWRAVRICKLLRLFSDAERQTEGDGPEKRLGEIAAPAEPAAEPQDNELLHLLEEEVAGVREEFEFAESLNEQKVALEREACLTPADGTWRTLLRQENALDRAIDRKVRMLLGLRKQYLEDQLTVRFPPAKDDEREMQEIDRILGLDLPFERAGNEPAPATSKMQERSGNVVENPEPPGNSSTENGMSVQAQAVSPARI